MCVPGCKVARHLFLFTALLPLALKTFRAHMLWRISQSDFVGSQQLKSAKPLAGDERWLLLWEAHSRASGAHVLLGKVLPRLSKSPFP